MLLYTCRPLLGELSLATEKFPGVYDSSPGKSRMTHVFEKAGGRSFQTGELKDEVTKPNERPRCEIRGYIIQI